MPENKPAYPHPEAKPVGGKRYFDKKPEKKFVDDIFSCYDRKVTVPVSEVLEEK